MPRRGSTRKHRSPVNSIVSTLVWHQDMLLGDFSGMLARLSSTSSLDWLRNRFLALIPILNSNIMLKELLYRRLQQVSSTSPLVDARKVKMEQGTHRNHEHYSKCASTTLITQSPMNRVPIKLSVTTISLDPLQIRHEPLARLLKTADMRAATLCVYFECSFLSLIHSI